MDVHTIYTYTYNYAIHITIPHICMLKVAFCYPGYIANLQYGYYAYQRFTELDIKAHTELLPLMRNLQLGSTIEIIPIIA